MIPLRTLWRFGRPHTVIGSVIGITTLYVIVCDRGGGQRWGLLATALVIGVACNLFITGINQLADVGIDRINKPHLPLPAGDLSMAQGWTIVYTALAVALTLALILSAHLFVVVGTAALIGWAYSMPPLYLKRHHLSAALAISSVRGVLLNLGGFIVYDHMVHGNVQVPMPVWVLTGFIIAFGVAIAWFKDVPDLEGDARFHIRTLALVYSPKVALIAGHVLVGLAYVGTIALFWSHSPNDGHDALRTRVLLVGHAGLFALFLANAASLLVDKCSSVRRFYVRFWWFFFGEYAVYLLAYLITATR